jgi:hypothetical protein
LNADPDPDPATQIKADPCGSGSETLGKIIRFFLPRMGFVFLLGKIIRYRYLYFSQDGLHFPVKVK